MADSQLIHTLGLVLVHFTWQGLLIGMLFAAGRLAMQGGSAVARYNWAVFCLLLMALAPILTLAWLSTDAGSEAVTGLAVMSENLQAGAASSVSGSSGWTPSALLPLIVGLWSIGVAAMSLRLGTGWWHVGQLRRRADFRVPPAIQSQLEHLAVELNMSRQVGLALSSRIAGPMLIGVFKPLILLPIGLVNRLSARELEMVLAHELAHLHRADHLVNLFQSIVETLLFYHPVVRWISNIIRAERELASDDQAARLTGDRICYAETLLKLEMERGDRPQFAIGMADHQLVTRVRHLLAPKPRQAGSIVFGMALLTLVLVSLLAGLVSTGLKALSEQDPVEMAQPLPVPEVTSAPATPMRSEVPAAATSTTERAESDSFSSVATRSANATELEAVEADPPTETFSSEPAIENDPVDPAEPADAATASDAPIAAEPLVEQATTGESVREPSEHEPTDIAATELPNAPTTTQPEEGLLLASLEPIPEAQVRGGTLINQSVPTYPTGAMRQRREGWAEVRLTVDQNGRVVDAAVIDESPRGYGFGEAAVQAVEQWQFEPFTRNGQPVRHEIQTGFDFTDPPACDRPRTGTRIARC